MNHLFSIIVPIYQAEQYVKRCVDCIERQTYSNYELVLINDGSTDRSYEICLEYAKKNNKIKVLTHSNRGQAFSRNKGIESCTGDYVLFLDVDDWLADDALETINSLLEDESLELILYKYAMVYENGKIMRVPMTFPDRSISGEEALKYLFRQKIRSYVSLAVKKTVLNDIRFPEGRIYEDTGTVYRIIGLSKCVGFIDKVLYFYYQRNNSTIHSYSTKAALDMLKNVDEQEIFVMNTKPELLDDFKVYELLMLSHCYSLAIKANADDSVKVDLLNRMKKNFTFRRLFKQNSLKDMLRITIIMMGIYK